MSLTLIVQQIFVNHSHVQLQDNVFTYRNVLRMYSVICFVVVPCDNNGDCNGSSGTTCVADYCQSPTCTATGQCVYGQKWSQSVFCNLYLCFVAVSCAIGCAGIPGTTCVADYCQPLSCTATGQCVYGQKCSRNDDSRTCVCKAYIYAVFYSGSFTSVVYDNYLTAVFTVYQ